jgi:ABC-2 type transport system ATP-binding protein
MTTPVIQAQALRKRYKDVEALRRIDLDVPPGSICGFLGRNGAGKTTTLRILLGMARPDSGSAQIFGLPVTDPDASVRIRQRIGFVPERKDLYGYMRVGEMIRFTRGLFPKWRADLERRYIDRFELNLDQKIQTLSRGSMTRLALMLALCRGADLLILDEPTEGLDPAMVEEVLEAIVSLVAEQGATVFFSSHQLHEVEQIADRVCLIHRGETLFSQPLEELKAKARRITAVFDGNAAQAAQQVASLGPVRQEGRAVSVLVYSEPEGAVARVRALDPLSLDVRPVGLKELFLESVRS